MQEAPGLFQALLAMPGLLTLNVSSSLLGERGPRRCLIKIMRRGARRVGSLCEGGDGSWVKCGSSNNCRPIWDFTRRISGKVFPSSKGKRYGDSQENQTVPRSGALPKSGRRGWSRWGRRWRGRWWRGRLLFRRRFFFRWRFWWGRTGPQPLFISTTGRLFLRSSQCRIIGCTACRVVEDFVCQVQMCEVLGCSRRLIDVRMMPADQPQVGRANLTLCGRRGHP